MQKVIIGDSILYNGDCREILEDIENVDVCLTDPPYGLGIKYNSFEDNAEEVKKIAESPIIQANKHGVDITRDMKIKEIVDIMQARYDSLNEKYNQCKVKYTETFVEMNNKLQELQKGKEDVES